MNVRIPDFIRPFFGKVIWRKKVPSSKTVYLTFDDGPVPEVTESVLKILSDYNCKATFFCVGDNVQKYPQLFERIILEGHRTGNHTFNHLRGWKSPFDQYVKNVEKAARLIDSDLFRPPHGRMTYTQLQEIKKKYRVIYWDVLSGDYDKRLSADDVTRRVTKHVRDGSIIVFHDSVKARNNVLNALPVCIESLKNKGYIFRTL
jgi:peptidoglycan-N-acetylglucosamine deacetylase